MTNKITDIRPIFATRITTIDDSELIGQLSEERRQINLLKSEIFLLKEQILILTNAQKKEETNNNLEHNSVIRWHPHKKMLQFIPIKEKVKFGCLSLQNTLTIVTNDKI